MSEYDHDFDQKSADAPEGEFGFDCDSNDVLYRYGARPRRVLRIQKVQVKDGTEFEKVRS